MRFVRWFAGSLFTAAPSIVAMKFFPGRFLWGFSTGLLAGVGARWWSREGEYGTGRARTAVAASLIVTAIALAWAMSAGVGELFSRAQIAKVILAREIAVEMQQAGVPPKFPPGLHAGNAVAAAHFPDEVWQKASEYWESMSDEERREFEREVDKEVAPYLSWPALVVPMGTKLFENGGGWIIGTQIMLAYLIGWGHAPQPPTPAEQLEEAAVDREPVFGEQAPQSPSSGATPDGDEVDSTEVRSTPTSGDG